MSNAFQSASHFLGGSFAPFAGPASRPDAPLFFSAVQEGGDDSDGEDDELSQQAGPSRSAGIRKGISSRQARTSADGDSGGGVEEEEDHGGLGQQQQGYGSDEGESEVDDEIDPFKPSSRKGAAAAAPAQRGWRMHQTSVLPQSVINDIYDHAASVYQSVSLRNDKGKQRARSAIDDTRSPPSSSRSPQSAVQSSPDTRLADEEVPEELQRAPSRPGYPADAEKQRTLHLSQSIQEQFSLAVAPTDGRLYRYPMPTSQYRRRASRKRAAEVEPVYQDQSPRDGFWLALYLFNVLFTALLAVWQFFLDTGSHIPDNLPTSGLVSPSVAILHSLPLLTGLVTCAMLVACTILAYLFLVKNGARHIVHLLIALPPLVLLAAAGWAFSSSYSHLVNMPAGGLEEVEHPVTAAEQFLRWTSFVLLGCSIVAMRFAFLRAASTRMERTIRVLDVAVDVLVVHPHLFMLAFGLLAAFVALSVPFLLLLAKLLIHGYVFSTANASSTTHSYLISSSWARLAAMHTAFVFFWTLAVLRGILRMTIAGATGEWWFHRHKNLSRSLLGWSELGRPETPTYSARRAKRTVQQAFERARGPSLGTVCISALLLSTFTALSVFLSSLNAVITRLRRRSYSAIPSMVLRILLNGVLLPVVAILGGILKNVNDFALVHAGITGDRFSDSMSEAQQLIAGRNGTDVIIAHMVLKSLLNLFALGFAVLGAIAGYLANAYWPSGEGDASGATPLLLALICGLLPYWSVRLAGDLLSNAVDATFVCFNIDLDMDTNNCVKAYEAFAYEDAEDEESVTNEAPGAYPEDV